MNYLLSYCGLVNAKIRASDKDLPVTKSRLVNEIALGKESGEVETFGVDWSNPHEMAGQLIQQSSPGRNRVNPRIINMILDLP